MKRGVLYIKNTSRFLCIMQFQHIFRQFDSQKSVFYAWFEAMHTRIDIALCNVSEVDSLFLMEKISNEIIRLEQMTNRFDDRSEISGINRLAMIEPFQVSEEIYDIIESCIDYNTKTCGAFDITIQSLNNFLHGIENIVLNSAEKSVCFKNKNIQIDLCGFIKGYALDRIRFMLVEHKCTNALVNMGNSSVLGLGNHPGGEGWKVNLPGKEMESVTLFNQCLTSSGNSSNHMHIVHPKTGQFGSSTEVISVITENAVQGEVLSTALCVCEPTQKTIICNNLGGEIL